MGCKLVKEGLSLIVQRNEMPIANEDILPVGLHGVCLDKVQEDIIVVDVGHSVDTFAQE